MAMAIAAHVGAEPEAETSRPGLWLGNANLKAARPHAITSGIEGPWTPNPTKWDMGYFELLFGYEWELTKSPAGANQWQPVGIKEEDMPGRRGVIRQSADDDRRRHGHEDGSGL
jgi:catalase-peroxidase